MFLHESQGSPRTSDFQLGHLLGGATQAAANQGTKPACFSIVLGYTPLFRDKLAQGPVKILQVLAPFSSQAIVHQASPSHVCV
jgi:hypothetical protein